MAVITRSVLILVPVAIQVWGRPSRTRVSMPTKCTQAAVTVRWISTSSPTEKPVGSVTVTLWLPEGMYWLTKLAVLDS